MDKHIGKEGAAVIVLSLMLTVVFALSVWMYDGIESEMSDGTLSGAAEAVRTFMNENEAIAAFLGMDPEEPAATEAVSEKRAAVAAAAEEYIARYNGIYRQFR